MRWVSGMVFGLLVFGSHRVISLQLWGAELCLLGNATHVTCQCFHARKVWTQAGKRANQIWFETLSLFSGHPCMLCSLCFACCAKCYLKTALDQPRSLYAANSAPEHGCLPAWCWEVHMTFLVNQDLLGLQFFFPSFYPANRRSDACYYCKVVKLWTWQGWIDTMSILIWFVKDPSFLHVCFNVVVPSLQLIESKGWGLGSFQLMLGSVPHPAGRQRFRQGPLIQNSSLLLGPHPNR